MSLTHGVVSNYTSDSARPIKVTSVLPIALVVMSVATLSAQLYGYDSLDKALKDMEDKNVSLADGTSLKYMQLGDLYNANAPVILSVARSDADAGVQKTNILEAIDRIKEAPSKVTYVPDIIIAPEVGFDTDIGNALISVAASFGARTFIDLDAIDNATAILRRNSFGSDRITPVMCGGGYQRD